MRTPALLCLCALLSSGCDDLDGDGYGRAEDCDDANNHVYPGADELCDGVDNNCDGAVDEDPANGFPLFVDADGDGYGADSGPTSCSLTAGFALVDGDCDDGDPTVHPGADELCDGVDDDCDGTVDEAPVDASTFYLDHDGDGYGDPDFELSACTQPSGYVTAAEDCDDLQSTVNPGADELCDGVDDDCNGVVDDDYASDAPTWYADTDGDGYGAPDTSIQACSQPTGYVTDASDCDDGAAGTNPGSPEICDNEIDEDCDGVALDCAEEISLSDADIVLVGEDADDYAGQALAPAGDFDGDGYDDLLISATWDDVTWDEAEGRGGGIDAGSVYLWLGPVSAGAGTHSLAEAPFKFVGEYTGDLVGYSAGSAGDLDGDGSDDLLIGAVGEETAGTNGGAFYLVFGGARAPDPGTLFLEDADLKLYGESAHDELGADVAHGAFGAGGAAALALGAYDTDTVGAIAAYMVTGAELVSLGPDPVDMATVGVTLFAENGLDINRRLVNGGDLDGDGLDDLIIGAYKSDLAATDGGAMYLLNGPITADLSLADADITLTLAETAGYLGRDVDGGSDVDGDGLPDLILSASGADDGGTDAGVVFLVSGGSLASGSVRDTSQMTLTGETDHDQVGTSVSLVADMNGDALADILIGTYTNDGLYSEGGAAYVVLGATDMGGIRDLQTADYKLLGEGEDHQAGYAVAAAGDVDDDGLGDLLVSAVGYQDSAGAVYLLLGGLGW